MIRHTWFTALVVLPAFAGLAAISAKDDSQSSPKSDRPPLGQTIRVTGFVELDEEKLAQVSSRLPGRSRLDKLLVRSIGERVQKGQALAELSSRELTVAVQELLDARRNGNRNLQRIARDRLRLLGMDDEQLDNILRTGKAVSRFTLHSPIDGYLIKKYHDEGDFIEEGTRLFDVADLSTVWITARIDEDKYALIRKGLSVRAVARAYPDKKFQGTIGFIEPLVDAETHTIGVRCELQNPHHKLRPGMFVTLTIAAAEAPNRADLAATKRDTAKMTYEASLKALQVGRADAEPVYIWSRRWMEAQRDASAKKADRIAALEAHRDRMKALRKMTEQRYKAGQGSHADVLGVDFYIAEAELWLSEANKAK